jgi:hypothetical protein
MNGKPIWRQAVESVDERVSRRVEHVVHNENFAIAVGLLMRARREVGAGFSQVTTGLLHAVNLPAKRDFDRVLRQLASLEREVLNLSDEGTPEPAAKARATRATSPARATKPRAGRPGGSREARST